MKVHILDDWHDTLRTLPSVARLAGHEATILVAEDELDQQFADIYDQINAFAAGAPIPPINPEALTRR